MRRKQRFPHPGKGGTLHHQSRRLVLARWAAVFFLTALLVDAIRPTAGLATNGLNLVGSGGISSALAGADTAVATDFSAMNTNPAGMVQIRGQHTGLSLSFIQPELHVRGGVGNNKEWRE
jgi:long-subunit fatty acid transport protein